MREAYRIEPPPRPVVTPGGEVQAAGINCSVHCSGNPSVAKSRSTSLGQDTRKEKRQIGAARTFEVFPLHKGIQWMWYWG